VSQKVWENLYSDVARALRPSPYAAGDELEEAAMRLARAIEKTKD
jgi:hypothetical protein